MTGQTAQERQALHEAWLAHPHVVAFRAAMADLAPSAGSFDAQGVSRMLAHASTWIAEHGTLPESGIICT